MCQYAGQANAKDALSELKAFLSKLFADFECEDWLFSEASDRALSMLFGYERLDEARVQFNQITHQKVGGGDV